MKVKFGSEILGSTFIPDCNSRENYNYLGSSCQRFHGKALNGLELL